MRPAAPMILLLSAPGCGGAPADWSQPGLGPSVLPDATPSSPLTTPPAELPVSLGDWAVEGCVPPGGVALAALRGAWQGPITFTQRLGPSTTTTTSDSTLALSLQGGPVAALPALGWSEPWQVHALGGTDLAPLWAAGGEGALELFAATGASPIPAEVLEGELCATSVSFEWRATVRYPWLDVLTQDTPDPGAPLALLQLHQAVAWDQRTGLLLSTIAEGSLSDGVPITMEATGTLEWIAALQP